MGILISVYKYKPGSEWLENGEGASTDFMVASGEVFSERYGMAGLASAWAMARRRPKEYRRKVDAATRCSGVCPHT